MLQPSSCVLRTMTDVSKGNYITALAILALVIVSVFAIVRPTMIVSDTRNPTQRTITVNGVGTVETAPDEALLILAVNNQAVTADQAVKDNANTMSQVMAAILSLGIMKVDVTTTDYSLTPVYTQSDKCVATTNNTQPQPQPFTCSTTTPQLIGYSVRNTIQVKVKDMTSIGRVLDAATEAGANDIGGISFTFTSNTYANLREQALEKAIQDASGQAQTMATRLGVHITGIVSVSPAYSYQPYINSRVNTAAGGAPTPIQTGTLQVTVNVQVVYEISP
jgi:uncharacterized protein YggE